VSRHVNVNASRLERFPLEPATDFHAALLVFEIVMDGSLTVHWRATVLK
jgi:hypothetical protein